MHGYGKTFRKRWPLYLLLPLIAAAGVGYLGLQKTSYQSTTSLWVDYSASTSSSLNLTPSSQSTAQPATVEQGTLTELLSTSAFDDAVATRAGVSPAMRSIVAGSLGTSVTSTVSGPQILAVTYTGKSAAETQKIAASVETELQAYTSKLEKSFDTAATKYTQSLYVSAAKAVASAKAAVNAYHFEHRSSTTENDQTYASLVSALASANSTLSTDRSSLNQDSAQGQSNSSAATITVMDAAALPVAQHAKKKTLIVKIIGAGIAGGLVSFLFVMLFTPGGSGREVDELYPGELSEQPRGLRPTPSPAGARSWTVGISSGAVAGGRTLTAGTDSGDAAESTDPSQPGGGAAPQIRVVLGDGQRQAGA